MLFEECEIFTYVEMHSRISDVFLHVWFRCVRAFVPVDVPPNRCTQVQISVTQVQLPIDLSPLPLGLELSLGLLPKRFCARNAITAHPM